MARLKDIGQLDRGRSRHRPRYAEHLYGGPYPFIQTGDIKAANGRITAFTQTYNEAGLAQSRLWPANTLCITIAANIAETAILTFPACFPDSVIGFIADESRCDVHFVEFMFRQLKQRIQLEASGSVQDNINLATFDRLYFPLPPLPEQREIARILAAFDDKTDLNRRMNAALEATARALFQSWFVDFDPVRAKAEGRAPEGMDAATAALFPDSFEDSALGPIPSGWRVGRLDDLLVLQRGFDLPSDQRIPGDYPIIAASGPSGTHNEYRVKGPGVTTGRSGVLGNVYFVHEDYWPLNTSLWVKEFRISAPHHAYFTLSTLDFSLLNAGSAVPTLNRNHVHDLPVVVPTAEIVKQFESMVSPLFALQHRCSLESHTLAETRDALLPRLISGELRV